MLLHGAGMLAGPLFVVFAHVFEDLFRYVNALLIGVLIAVCSIFFELYIFDRYFKKLPFYLVLLARSGFYFFVVILVSLTELTVARIIRYEQKIAGVWASEEFQDYLSSEYPYVLLYAFALVAAVNFTRQMVRKVGYDVMLNLIGGRYYKPVFENRIFMSLSLTEPHQLAEKLGGIHFHRFLNDFIFDITQPILANHGEIYQYVEDEIVVTWKEQNGLKNNRWFRAYHEAKQALEKSAMKRQGSCCTV
jgi:adenylate cyclase